MSSLEKRKEGMGLGEYEQKAVEAGFVRVCGCDEAGAGPLAGPVYAAAVILAQGADIPGLNDSKKLTEKKREALFPLIQQSALAWSVARVEAEEIDRTDILSARIRAMQLAIEGLSLRPDFALIDGNRDHGRSAAITVPHWCVVKGDSISPSIAAAPEQNSRCPYTLLCLPRRYHGAICPVMYRGIQLSSPSIISA